MIYTRETSFSKCSNQLVSSCMLCASCYGSKFFAAIEHGADTLENLTCHANLKLASLFLDSLSIRIFEYKSGFVSENIL